MAQSQCSQKGQTGVWEGGGHDRQLRCPDQLVARQALTNRCRSPGLISTRAASLPCVPAPDHLRPLPPAPECLDRRSRNTRPNVSWEGTVGHQKVLSQPTLPNSRCQPAVRPTITRTARSPDIDQSCSLVRSPRSALPYLQRRSARGSRSNQSCLFSDRIGLYPALYQRTGRSLTVEQMFFIITTSTL